MKYYLKIFFLAFIFFAFGCKKDSSVLGVDVQPSSDDLNAESLRDIPVTAHSLPYDSIATYNDRYKFIGSNDDPHFGRTDIGLYLNANMSVTDLNFGVSSQITSAEIVLALDALEFAGDKNASLTFSIFPIENALNPKEIYFTSDARRHNQTPISMHTTTYTVEKTGQASLRIKLDATYAQSLLNDTPNLTSNEVFQAKYKGYYIAASFQSGQEGVIFKADLEDDLSGLYLNYKTTTLPSDTIISFKFTFKGSSSSKYNTMKFTPKQNLKDQFLDTTLGATNLYLKGMGMSRVKIQIPFLKDNSDSFNIAVNRAELILNIDPAFESSVSRYLTPPKLLLLSIDSLGRETYLQDLLTTTDYSRYDGNYDAVNKRYVFNIAREAQLIFGGKKKNRGFYLVVANADFSLKTIYSGTSKELLPLRRDNYYERVVIAGNNNLTLKPRFNLNYIRFKND